MTDADVICCTRLVEAQLGPDQNTTVITELFCDTNHRFIPLTNLSNADAAIDEEIMNLNVRKSMKSNTQMPGNEAMGRSSLFRSSVNFGNDHGGDSPSGRAS